LIQVISVAKKSRSVAEAQRFKILRKLLKECRGASNASSTWKSTETDSIRLCNPRIKLKFAYFMSDIFNPLIGYCSIS
jgi:hypothetical protein